MSQNLAHFITSDKILQPLLRVTPSNNLSISLAHVLASVNVEKCRTAHTLRRTCRPAGSGSGVRMGMRAAASGIRIHMRTAQPRFLRGKLTKAEQMMPLAALHTAHTFYLD